MELQIDHISKHFKDKEAVRDVSLHITPGVWGLLGANGAGKTTLIRMVAGIMKPSAGKVLYDGIPIEVLGEKYRERFGYLPQEFGFYPEFTVKDYLSYMAALKGFSKGDARVKIDRLLQKLSLTQVRSKPIKKLSGGMKRRVGIAQALLNDPDILILDEPTSGLDPAERMKLRKLLSEFAQERIVLISTHIVPDVEYIATQHAIMRDGAIAALGSTEALVQQMEGRVWSCMLTAAELPKYEQTLQIVNLRNEPGGKVSVRYLAGEALAPDSTAVRPRLEDLYLWMFPQTCEEEE